MSWYQNNITWALHVDFFLCHWQHIMLQIGRFRRCLSRTILLLFNDERISDFWSILSQSKASSDKRRWSFRKRSARHRVLSNSVVSEPVSISYNKESTEVVTNTFDSPIYSSIPEKKSIEQRINETFPLPSAVVDSEVAIPPATNENFPANDINLDESVAIVIQAAIRGYLVYSFLSSNYFLYFPRVCIIFLWFPMNMFRLGENSKNLRVLSSCKLLYVDIWLGDRPLEHCVVSKPL